MDTLGGRNGLGLAIQKLQAGKRKEHRWIIGKAGKVVKSVLWDPIMM